MPTGTDANKRTIEGLIRTINEHRVADLPDYLALNVVDHNKIIRGKADGSSTSFSPLCRSHHCEHPGRRDVDRGAERSVPVGTRLGDGELASH